VCRACPANSVSPLGSSSCTCNSGSSNKNTTHIYHPHTHLTHPRLFLSFSPSLPPSLFPLSKGFVATGGSNGTPLSCNRIGGPTPRPTTASTTCPVNSFRSGTQCLCNRGFIRTPTAGGFRCQACAANTFWFARLPRYIHIYKNS